MPKSKRDKKISLTKVSKKGRALNEQFIENVKDCARQFNSIYIFSFINIRNNSLKEIRNLWKPSRIFIGKNKVMAVALGRTKEEEIENGLHKLKKILKGQCGVLFTNCKKPEVIDWFKTFSFDGYARSGFVTPIPVSLKEGPLKEFNHTQEPYLRQLGLPVKLNKGVVTLIKDYDVCTKGQVLNPSQAKILELLDIKVAPMKFILKASWSKDTGVVEKYKNKEQVDDNQVDEEMEAESNEEEDENDE